MADQLSDNFSYNKNLQPLAVQLRKNATKSEACLWKYALKSKQMQGYAFRRQRPVLQYIADFLCKELMLIIELDGITHDNEIANVRDKHREEQLTRAGFKIVRFTDKDVLNNMAGVILKLEKIISDIEASTPLIPRQRGTTALSSAGAESGEFPRGVLRHAPGKLRDGGGKLATLKNVKTL